jgi:hypothetical protein
MKYFFHLSILALFIFSTSCKKYLEEKSQDEVRPSTIQDLNSLMSGDGYPYQTNLSPILDLITDDVQCNGGQGQAAYKTVVKKGKAPYTWSKEMFQELVLADGFSSTVHVNSWKIIYSKISVCNTVLAYINRVSGDEVAKNNLKGQALSMRAYYYFLLVNMFGKPYNTTGLDPEASPGVPLKLTMEVTDSLNRRNSVAEVYRQIESDLKQGAALMEASPLNNSIYRMNELAAFTLLSRVYLFQEKWDECIAYADKVIARRPALTQLATYRAGSPGGYYVYNNGTPSVLANRIYDPSLSKEILFAYVPMGNGTGVGGSDEVFRTAMSPSYSAKYNPPYSASSELLSLYESRPVTDSSIYLGDLRSRIYFNQGAFIASITPPATINFGFKILPGSYGQGGIGLRTAEAYLNRAEAKAQKALGGNAAMRVAVLSDINTLRVARYDKRKAYVSIDITDLKQLLNFVREERRREFPFEGHRWFDLRRYGMPSISHYYEEDPGTGQMITLTQGDSRYTLPIPREVLERNGNLIQNP